MVPNERSTLCGHLEPKMAKIGPELTEWWPFFQDVLHLGGRPSRSSSYFAGGRRRASPWGVTYEVKNPQGTDFRKFYKKTKLSLEKLWAHTNFHRNPTVGSKVLLHTADPNCPLYEVKNLQGTDFRTFYKNQSLLLLSVVLTQIFIKI